MSRPMWSPTGIGFNDLNPSLIILVHMYLDVHVFMHGHVHMCTLETCMNVYGGTSISWIAFQLY